MTFVQLFLGLGGFLAVDKIKCPNSYSFTADMNTPVAFAKLISCIPKFKECSCSKRENARHDLWQNELSSPFKRRTQEDFRVTFPADDSMLLCSGCTWLPCACSRDPLLPVVTCGYLRPLAATRVAASGCQGLRFWKSNGARFATSYIYRYIEPLAML